MRAPMFVLLASTTLVVGCQAAEDDDPFDSLEFREKRQRILVADDPDSGPEKMRHYFVAKQNADNHLRASKLAYTIVRPGKLTEDEGTGKVRLAERLGDFGEIPRQDVAAVLEAVLENPATAGREFDLLSGDQPVADAVTAFAR